MATKIGDGDRRRLWFWVSVSLAGGAALWLAGWLLLAWLAPEWVEAWHALCALAGISFLGAVILPVPGSTTALLVVLRSNVLLGSAGVLGAAIGGTVGAALLFGLGDLGKAILERKAKRSKWSRKVLHWSKALVKRWTYVAVGLLIVPPFLPRMAVLYPAVLLRLHIVPFLVAVFLGTLVRNGLYFLGIHLAWG